LSRGQQRSRENPFPGHYSRRKMSSDIPSGSWEFDLHVGRCGMEFFLDFRKDGLEGFDVDLSPEFIQYLDEPAHMGSLEVVGEVDIHIDGCIDGLGSVGTVQDNDRVFDALYPYLLNIDLSVVFLVLNVDHRLCP